MSKLYSIILKVIILNNKSSCFLPIFTARYESAINACSYKSLSLDFAF